MPSSPRKRCAYHAVWEPRSSHGQTRRRCGRSRRSALPSEATEGRRPRHAMRPLPLARPLRRTLRQVAAGDAQLGASSTRAVHERELLAVLLDKAQHGRLRREDFGALSPADFRSSHAAATFRAVCVLVARASGGAVDRHELVSELVTAHRASRAHATAYVGQLISSVPHQHHLRERHARVHAPVRTNPLASPVDGGRRIDRPATHHS